MKKFALALALFAFVGSSAVTAAPFDNGDKDKTEKKEKKNKKNKKGKDCTTAEMKSCAPGSAATSAGKSCCASKAKAAATTETQPVPAQ